MKLTKKELKQLIHETTLEVVGRLMEGRLDDKRAKAAALEDIYKEMAADEDIFQRRNPRGIDIDGQHFDDSEKIRRHFSQAEKNHTKKHLHNLKNSFQPKRVLLTEIDKLEHRLQVLTNRKQKAMSRQEALQLSEEIKNIRQNLSRLRREYDNTTVNQDNFSSEKIRAEKRSALNRFREQRSAREQAFNDKRQSNREILQRLKDTDIESYD